MEDVNIGDIYCYTNRSIVSPSDYKSRRRVSGIGIVAGNNGGIIRIVSVQAHNRGNKYKFMDGNCMYDYPDVNSTIYVDSAFRDMNGTRNTEYTRSCSLGFMPGYDKFTWNSLKYLNMIEKMYKGENDWYIPSVGEIKTLLENREKVLESLNFIKDETLSKILGNEKNIDIISSTQRGRELMYGVHLDLNIEYHHKLDDVYGVSFKRLRLG